MHKMQHVANGSTVWSDEWAEYNRVGSLPNVSSHGVVNHSLEFVNRATGVHNQNIESYWNGVKSSARECMAAMGTSLQATLTSLCTGKGMVAQQINF